MSTQIVIDRDALQDIIELAVKKVSFSVPDHHRIEPLWTKGQVADYCQVSEKTVSNWVEMRRIPFVKPGAREADKESSRAEVRFDPAEIRAWVKRMSVPAQVKISVAQRRKQA